MSNATTLFRSFLVYAVCLPLAVVLGYMLADPLTFGTIGAVGAVFLVMAIPLLLRWHHAWLIATWNTTAVMVFVPGHPQVWMALAAASFTIAILQYALNRKLSFLHAPSVVWPVIILTLVILITARLTGGFGARLFGGDTYGGKRYFTILVTVLGYFAIVHRRIPPQRAALYVALFFLGAATMAIGHLAGVVSPGMNWLFTIFPVMNMEAMADPHSVVAQTGYMSRLNGLSSLGIGCFCALLACYGIRGVLDTRKPLRLAAFCLFCLIAMFGGFRSSLILLVMTFALLFYLERLHHTKWLVTAIFVVVLGGALVAAFARELPLQFQRSLSILPYIPLDPMVRLDAQGSTEWRLEMWRDVVPQIPQYLLVGKGYSFSGTEQFQIGQKLEGTELVGDYHNGPLSVLLPFGLFGAIAFTWLLVAGIRVVYHNYQFGDPAFRTLNTFLFAFFIVKVIFFCAIFGSLHSDLPMFLGILGLSISINGGVAKPVVVPPEPAIVFNRFKLHPSARRPVGA
jgi:hypothetical protein